MIDVSKARVAAFLLLVGAVAALRSADTSDATSVARYDGLGATVSAFRAATTHGPGYPPVGVAYLRGPRLSQLTGGIWATRSSQIPSLS
jgi:hypothetical protein